MYRFLSSLLIVAAAGGMTLQSQAAGRYVTPGGTGDGLSWATATGNLQAAIDASKAGDTVYVAAGTYKPDSLIKSTKKTSKAFFLKDGVSLMGSYTLQSDGSYKRVPGAHPWEFQEATVLSADDDVPDTWTREIAAGTTYRYSWKVENNEIPGTKGNSSHVLYASAVIAQPTVVDGFVLTGANANVYQAKAAGGALYAKGNVTLRNCQVLKNSAYYKVESMSDSNTYGGAVYLVGTGYSNAGIENCYFDSNYSHSAYGSGMGGGVYVKDAKVTGCTLANCVATDEGGAIYNDGGVVSNVTVTDCYAGSGGAVYNNGGGTLSQLQATLCRGLQGGAVYNLGRLDGAVIYNCYADATDYGDTMGGRGGALYNKSGDVTNVVAFNNTSFDGGGVYLAGGRLINCTAQYNMLRAASDTANVGFASEALKTAVYNTIGNGDADAANFAMVPAFKGFSTDAEKSAALTANAGKYFNLASGSSYIDAGQAVEGFEMPATDAAGQARVQGQSVDVGAYEYTQAEQVSVITINFADSLLNKDVRLGIYTTGDFQIQWGDGEKQTGSKTNYYSGTLTKPYVHIYGDNVYRLLGNNCGITAIDVTKAPAVKLLQLDGNNIETIDLRNNPLCTGIYIEGSGVKNLYLDGAKAMKVVSAADNHITTPLDLTGMSELSKVVITGSQVPSLKLPKTSTLLDVECADNQLTELDVAGLPSLETLQCSGNQLKSLDLTGDVKLETLSAADNQLSTIDLSACTALQGLYLQNNNLTSLDLSKNTDVRWLRVDGNHLTALNTAAQANLSTIMADNNEIETLDFTSNPRLSMIKASHNKLTSIDASKSSYLSWLKVDNNNLTSLDVSKNAYLYWLECDSNAIAQLDVTACTYLQWLAAENNNLATLDVSKNTGLQGLSIQNNPMSATVLNTIIDQLPDVSSVEINDNNRAWGRQLRLSHNAVDDVHLAVAQGKGWNVTEYLTTGVSTVDARATVVKTVYYSLDGVCLGTEVPARGIYIATDLYSNGATRARKVVTGK